MLMVRCSDGAEIAVYDPNPGGSPTVLLVPGFLLPHQMYEYQVQELLRRGYRPVAFDPRGGGFSAAEVGDYSYSQMAKDILHIVNTLRLHQFVLVGFSTGGAVALRYMNQCGGQGVKKLVLLAAASNFPSGALMETAARLQQLARADRPQMCWELTRILFKQPHSEAVLEWFSSLVLAASPLGTSQFLENLCKEDCRWDLAHVHVPTAIFQGAEDVFLPCGLTEYQHREIGNSRLYTMEHSGHGLFYDELEPFNAAFFSFIAEE